MLLINETTLILIVFNQLCGRFHNVFSIKISPNISAIVCGALIS